MATTTNLSTLKINYLTQEQYDTATNNDEINENEIYLTPNPVVDYIVEQGTTGNWTWRKWNSDIVEAWYLGGGITYTGTNMQIVLPHTPTAIKCLTGNGILNGYATTAFLSNLWSSQQKIYISFSVNSPNSTIDMLSLYVVYTV